MRLEYLDLPAARLIHFRPQIDDTKKSDFLNNKSTVRAAPKTEILGRRILIYKDRVLVPVLMGLLITSTFLVSRKLHNS